MSQISMSDLTGIVGVSSANRRAILSMVAAMACFMTNDALVKYVSDVLPSGQLISIRGVMACLLIGAFTILDGSVSYWHRLLDGPVIWRAFADGIATMLYLTALFHIPIANATAINQSLPLLLTIVAFFFFKEKVGWYRWTAVAIGFVGVIFVVQPKADGFNAYALVALAATFLHVVRDLVMRRVSGAIPSSLVTLSTAFSVMFLAVPLSIVQGWVPVPPQAWWQLLAAACFLAGGYYFLIEGTRVGEMSAVAPFRYSALFWALILGFVVWRDVPNLETSIGILLLLGSGLYVLHRERIRAREKDRP